MVNHTIRCQKSYKILGHQPSAVPSKIVELTCFISKKAKEVFCTQKRITCIFSESLCNLKTDLFLCIHLGIHYLLKLCPGGFERSIGRDLSHLLWSCSRQVLLHAETGTGHSWGAGTCYFWKKNTGGSLMSLPPKFEMILVHCGRSPGKLIEMGHFPYLPHLPLVGKLSELRHLLAPRAPFAPLVQLM